MLQNRSAAETSIDAETAEKALSLAIRLQQEQGERVSIAELQRTADEAGIDRVSLERALEHLGQRTGVEPVGDKRGPPRVAPIIVFFAVVLTLISRGIPMDSHIAKVLATLGGFGFAAACLLFARFLWRNGYR